MIAGTIIAGSVGRVLYQVALTVTRGDNGFVSMFFNLVPALTAFVSIAGHVVLDRRTALYGRSHIFPWSGLERGVAHVVLAEVLAAAALRARR